MLAIFGSSSLSTKNLISSLTNKYKIPYITWSPFGKYKLETPKSKIKYNIEESISLEESLSNQLFMRPDFVPALIKLIEFYKWSPIYYIYNYEQGNLQWFYLLSVQVDFELII